ncbi:hypothetical protein ALC57_01956 [Trachymyrmex cornetzi]|uniref:Uncharacterized protein n=1 Tax=Trachymyrmex cornetzi TaxID=471704 RepID=A0A151JPG8_9HYME|nr:hypothetical protein ALC57_01956 [Trachymyrmex cornetzi]
MLFTTTYGLNNSHTKTIHVGLQRTNEGIFEPLVKLSGNNDDGIYFDADSWKQFQDNMGYMNEYLTSDNRMKTNSIVRKNISISFTTSYGAKSILLAYEEEELRSMENISGNLRKEEVASDSTPSKKRRTFAVAIVMQKTTFLRKKYFHHAPLAEHRRRPEFPTTLEGPDGRPREHRPRRGARGKSIPISGQARKCGGREQRRHP